MRILTLMWGGVSKNRLHELIRLQKELLDVREERIHDLEDALDKVDLQHAIATRNLVEHFLVALEEDDEGLRDGIASGLSDLKDHVARLEEHSGI